MLIERQERIWDDELKLFGFTKVKLGYARDLKLKNLNLFWQLHDSVEINCIRNS